jgi:hypothetical protein
MTSTTPTRRQWAWVLVVLLTIALVVVGLYAALISAQNTQTVVSRQRTNTATNDANAQTLALLKDCLTPGGKCYQRQQKQTSGVVGVIGKGDVLSAAAAAWCAAEKRQQTFDEILRCTLAHVKTANGSKG